MIVNLIFMFAGAILVLWGFDRGRATNRDAKALQEVAWPFRNRDRGKSSWDPTVETRPIVPRRGEVPKETPNPADIGIHEEF